jgi:hypothetical protein
MRLVVMAVAVSLAMISAQVVCAGCSSGWVDGQREGSLSRS